jgi:hypothetical protein
MDNLQKLLSHLRELGTESQRALWSTADCYQGTDEKTAVGIDATYPPVPRSRPDMDTAQADPWHE